MAQELTLNIISVIRSIPSGYVLSYGEVAKRAGNPRAARQVVRTLHHSTQKYDLPWHRVINSRGEISLPYPHGEEQQRLLESEGIVFKAPGKLDLKIYLWKGNWRDRENSH